MRPASSSLTLLCFSFILSIKTSHGLYCLVGKGNSSEVLPTDIPTNDEDIQKLMKEKGSGPLKFGSYNSRECSKDKDSVLKNVEALTKDVKKKIEDGVNGLQKLGSSLSETLSLDQRRRKKREDSGEGAAAEGEEAFACAKIVMGGKAFRSCVPKVGDVEKKCTAGTGLSVCYCHGDNCNASSGLSFSLLPLAAALLASLKL